MSYAKVSFERRRLLKELGRRVMVSLHEENDWPPFARSYLADRIRQARRA